MCEQSRFVHMWDVFGFGALNALFVRRGLSPCACLRCRGDVDALPSRELCGLLELPPDSPRGSEAEVPREKDVPRESEGPRETETEAPREQEVPQESEGGVVRPELEAAERIRCSVFADATTGSAVC